LIRLENYTAKIVNWINQVTDSFNIGKNDVVLIGFYICPWSGWVSINFSRNVEASNCPNFDFPEHSILEIEDWELEYVQSNVVVFDNEGFSPHFSRIQLKKGASFL
jgi:hypothetical protein